MPESEKSEIISEGELLTVAHLSLEERAAKYSAKYDRKMHRRQLRLLYAEHGISTVTHSEGFLRRKSIKMVDCVLREKFIITINCKNQLSVYTMDDLTKDFKPTEE